MRQKIIDVAIDDKAALILMFEKGEELKLLTNTDIVDWHLALKKNR
ncbi:MAG: hypothetical protein JKY19_14030 [Alcanivoracaceae bacterium]|nr:hypothetical protein [Alcanivoracaceae bacterium]